MTRPSSEARFLIPDDEQQSDLKTVISNHHAHADFKGNVRYAVPDCADLISTSDPNIEDDPVRVMEEKNSGLYEPDPHDVRKLAAAIIKSRT